MSYEPAPLSKTAKYKKITKPLLERKRRARINRCLDELKDLMVGALEIDDEHLSKLEKADILELTVNHLTKLHTPKDPFSEAQKFHAGFGQCAAEACRFIMSVPDLDETVSRNLIHHLRRMISAQSLTIQLPDKNDSPPVSPSSVASDGHQYYNDYEKVSDTEESQHSGVSVIQQWPHVGSSTELKRVPLTAGLLTTVDKMHGLNYDELEQSHDAPTEQRRRGYYNRVPTEAKDVILQKIRQHIMDKRSNEYNVNMAEIHAGTQLSPEREYIQRDEVQKVHSHPANISSNNNKDTLDLRKIRTPMKSVNETAHALGKRAAYRSANQLDTITSTESKVEAAANLPEQCELPMDYSNLPPKKKRLIEYKEYKKQEEAKRQLEASRAEKKQHPKEGSLELDGDTWRPW